MTASNENLASIMSAFEKLRILVVGDLMADKYVYGNAERLSPEAAVPVVKVKKEEYRLGGAANVAHNAKQLGATVLLCGVVGYDDAAHMFRKAVREAGIESGGIFPSSDRSTTLKVRVVALPYNQQIVRYDYESRRQLSENETPTVKRYIESNIDQIDAILISDYDKGMLLGDALPRFIIDLARHKNVPTIVHSKQRRFRLFANATAIILGYYDAQDFVHVVSGNFFTSIAAICEQLVKALECDAVLVMREDQELGLCTRDGVQKTFEVGVENKFNPAGAQDAVCSTFALALAGGASPENAAILASRAMKVVLSKEGTATITIGELH
ncbi:MAG: hypothetical protein DRH70_00180 [Candidatus Coatesbacteria bacterium]|nr:MAG: hypothetical protein DRH70_00180 [Candidatus Coatesbacteria bacterium]